MFRWVEAVFSLVWAVVSVQHGAASMTECGLIPALLNVVQLNMDGQVRAFSDPAPLPSIFDALAFSKYLFLCKLCMGSVFRVNRFLS